jgi:hypothetical protein
VRQDTKLIEGHVQITVREALPGQLRAWAELWSKLLAPLQTENSTMLTEAATAPEDSGAASASKAEQGIAEALGHPGGESAHV